MFASTIIILFIYHQTCNCIWDLLKRIFDTIVISYELQLGLKRRLAFLKIDILRAV